LPAGHRPRTSGGGHRCSAACRAVDGADVAGELHRLSAGVSHLQPLAVRARVLPVAVLIPAHLLKLPAS
jgi:hypothetical protein